MGLGRCGSKCGVPDLVYTLPSLIGQAPLECILLSECSWSIWSGIILREVSDRGSLICPHHHHHHCLLIGRMCLFFNTEKEFHVVGTSLVFFLGGGIQHPPKQLTNHT